MPQRQFRMAAKKVARTEQTEEARPQQQQPDMDRYLLQIDRQTKSGDLFTPCGPPTFWREHRRKGLSRL